MDNLLNQPFIGAGTKTINPEMLSPEAWTIISGGQDSSGSELRKLYQRVSWLFRGVEIRSNGIASMPFAIYTQGGDEVDSSEDYKNVVKFLPNPGALFGLVEMALTIWGYAYLERQLNALGNRPWALVYLLPSTITVDWDYYKETGELRFKRALQNQTVILEADDLAYFWKYDPFVEFGPPISSPAQAASADAGVVLSVNQFAEAFFKRGAIKATLLTTEGVVVETERRKLKDWWSRMFLGIKRAWQTEIINADKIKPVVVGEGLESLENPELSAEKRRSISTALGIPHSMLFSDASNYATAQQDELNLYKSTLVPECRFIQAVLNEQVFEPAGYHLEFTPENLDIFQEDENERAASLEKLVNVFEMGETVEVAMDVLGYEISEENLNKLRKIWASKKQEAERIREGIEQGQQEEQGKRPPEEAQENPRASDMSKWRRKALKALGRGEAAAVPFDSEHIHPAMHGAILGALSSAKTPEQVEAVFTSPWMGYP